MRQCIICGPVYLARKRAPASSSLTILQRRRFEHITTAAGPVRTKRCRARFGITHSRASYRTGIPNHQAHELFSIRQPGRVDARPFAWAV